MNTKLRKTLSEKCKDFGLTEKALDELAELGSEGISDETSDEDLAKKVDLLVPFAKAMQGEITRKTRKSNHNQTSKSEEVDDEGDDKIAALISKQLAPLTEQLNTLKAENDAMKAEKAKTERTALIASKAKELGIPEYLTKRLAIAEDADLDQELAAYKQDLVNNNLMPKDQASEQGKPEEQMKADAKSWAESLPNK